MVTNASVTTQARAVDDDGLEAMLLMLPILVLGRMAPGGFHIGFPCSPRCRRTRRATLTAPGAPGDVMSSGLASDTVAPTTA